MAKCGFATHCGRAETAKTDRRRSYRFSRFSWPLVAKGRANPCSSAVFPSWPETAKMRDEPPRSEAGAGSTLLRRHLLPRGDADRHDQSGESARGTPCSTSPRPSHKNWGRRGSGSTASRRDRWQPSYGSATRPASTQTPCANKRSRACQLGRFTTPEEIATLVTLLASPRTGNVTRSNYVIDGGLIKTM